MWSLVAEYSFSASHYYGGVHGANASLHGHDFLVRAHFAAEKLSGVGVVLERRDVQKLMARVCGDFEHIVINKVEPFDEVNPTPENMAQYVYEGLESHLESVPKGFGLRLEWVEIKAGCKDFWVRYVPEKVKVFV